MLTARVAEATAHHVTVQGLSWIKVKESEVSKMEEAASRSVQNEYKQDLTKFNYSEENSIDTIHGDGKGDGISSCGVTNPGGGSADDSINTNATGASLNSNANRAHITDIKRQQLVRDEEAVIENAKNAGKLEEMMEMLRQQTEKMARIKKREGSPKHPVRLSVEKALKNQDAAESSAIVNANRGKENEEDVRMEEDENNKPPISPNQENKKAIKEVIPVDPEISAQKGKESPSQTHQNEKDLTKKPERQEPEIPLKADTGGAVGKG